MQKSNKTKRFARYSRSGFALITVLMLMVLLTILAVGLLSLASVSLRSSTIENANSVARANARLSVMIAIGELQKHAGPDRRITTNGTFSAPATSTGYGKEPSDPSLKNPWLTGVWQRDASKPLDPNESGYLPQPVDLAKTAWIVSGNEIPGATQTTPTTSIAAPTASNSKSVWMLRKYLEDAGLDPTTRNLLSVKVPLVPVTEGDGAAGITTGAYGYWVSDQSQKAALGSGRAIAIDYAGHANAPSNTELARLGLASSPSSLNQILGLNTLPPSADANWKKIFTVNSLEVTAADPKVIRQGIAKNFHSLAEISDGVQADAKLGGLKRDLSMAFESEDAVFNKNPFYTREGQTKGSNSDVSGKNLASFNFVNSATPEWGTPTMPVTEPFSHEMIFYKDSDDAPLFFKSPSSVGGNFIRLSTWHALRDYYRTYKKVGSVDTSPSFAATPTGLNFPAASSIVNAANEYVGRGNTSADSDTGNTRFKFPPDVRSGRVLINPTTSGFKPVVARLQIGFSFISGSGSDNNPVPRTKTIKLVADPIVTLWNPFNTRLDVTGFSLSTWLPDMLLVIEKQENHKANRLYRRGDQCVSGNLVYEATTDTTTAPGSGTDWVKKSGQNGWILASHARFENISANYGGGRMTINLANGGNLSMEPGELTVFSPNKSTPVDYSGTGGWTFDMERGWEEEGGIAMDRLRTNLASLPPVPFPNVNDRRVFVDPDASVRMTIEPLRASWQNSYIARDPFGFIARYPNGGFAVGTTASNLTNDNDGMPYTELLKIPGVANPAQTRNGFEIRTSYEGRKFLGTYGADKPNPGMSDVFTVSQLDPKNKRWLGSFDWYLRNEADVGSFPVVMGKSNPRYDFQNTGSSANLSPYRPTTTMPYQLLLRRETSASNMTQMDSSSRGYWGPSNTSGGETHVPMFEIPTSPMVSLAQFQHFQASPFDHDPAYIIGASDSTPQIARNKASEVRQGNTFVDRSWYNNEVLFDSFFFSSLRPVDLISVVDDNKPLRNSRFKFVTAGEPPVTIKTRLNDTTGKADKAVAANVLIRGSFNVNSTSVEAWKAFIASAHGIQVAIAEPGSPVSLQATQGVPVSRTTTPNGDKDDLWRGYRELDDAELTKLSEEIVKQVRLRGPFLSVSDFVNRRLKNDATGDGGVLHIAIRDANLNADFTTAFTTNKFTQVAQLTGHANNYPFPAQAVGKIAQGAAPGFIQQGDLLQSIAPALTVHGDTFVIRGYGEARSKTGEVTARAWCEVTVQRTARYVDHTDDANAPLADLPWAAPDSLKSLTNRSLGRRFNVISFRWLNQNEI